MELPSSSLFDKYRNITLDDLMELETGYSSSEDSADEVSVVRVALNRISTTSHPTSNDTSKNSVNKRKIVPVSKTTGLKKQKELPTPTNALDERLAGVLKLAPTFIAALRSRDMQAIVAKSPPTKKIQNFMKEYYGSFLQIPYLQEPYQVEENFFRDLYNQTTLKNEKELWNRLFYFLFFMNDEKSFAWLAKELKPEANLLNILLYLPSKRQTSPKEYAEEKCQPLFTTTLTGDLGKAYTSLSEKPFDYLQKKCDIPPYLEITHEQLYFAQLLFAVHQQSLNGIRKLVKMESFKSLTEEDKNRLFSFCKTVHGNAAETILKSEFQPKEARATKIAPEKKNTDPEPDMHQILNQICECKTEKDAQKFFETTANSDLRFLFAPPYVQNGKFTKTRQEHIKKICEWKIPFSWHEADNASLAIQWKDPDIVELLFTHRWLLPDAKGKNRESILESLIPEKPDSLTDREKKILDLFKNNGFMPTAEFFKKIEKYPGMKQYLTAPISQRRRKTASFTKT